MAQDDNGAIARLVTGMLGATAGRAALGALTIDPALLAERGSILSRAAFAMAMNIVLFHGLLDRVPSGRAYVQDVRARGERVTFDHGALRTIRFAQGPTGSLPPGEAAFTRILRPLGYDMAAVYPLDRLKMTGRAYRHADAPAAIPQFFLSELHVERFDAAFAEAAHRVFDASGDPLDDRAIALLTMFAANRQAPFTAAAASLPTIVSAFDRKHPLPDFDDYQLLLSRSNEAAWIATEGNAFNHATDRVVDVAALADRLRTEGRPVKEKVEISASGRVRQTAFRADSVEREFAGRRLKTVPGSFYEFISRDIDPATGAIDLGFDTGNATGIFAMTQAAGPIAD